MSREFNITGTCIAEKHYMVDISENLKEVFQLVEKGNYFTISRPRQFGKTTSLFYLKKMIRKNPDYLVSSISFEGIGDAVFRDEKTFCPFVLKLIGEGFFDDDIQKYLEDSSASVTDIKTLSGYITIFVKKYNKKIVLMIDEVDKSSNNQLFLSFIGMLRNKYLFRDQGEDHTFQSVILAGLHDVRTLKLKLRPDEEQKFNSPWNIATDFKVDMSFDPREISTMLIDYANDKKVEMDIMKIAERIHHYTSGYPFLVSRICKEIDEEILPKKTTKTWSEADIDNAARDISAEWVSNTNYESLVKNIEDNDKLYTLCEELVCGSNSFAFNLLNPTIYLGVIHGLFGKGKENKVDFHNKIYEVIITNYITSKLSLDKSKDIASEAVSVRFERPDGSLDIEKVLLKFQEVIKEKYSQSEVLKSNEFLEKNLRLLFLVFLKPIINGRGFSFKEVETGAEKRIDIVIIFQDEKFVGELKLWRGAEYHKEGMERLKNYMKHEGAEKGYMLIMDKTRHKEFIVENEEGVMMVWI
ncbi:MAG: hypothetical protein A3H98_06850 [Bacteroidetes bacterium RIFCSPLOWO2_02_FULL_36_8]|nr:MAG: hypothetical protein A3H98_06850 [Bacteroidetes bacterium RIFCSPLOWO2_02_FULL_36_8]